MFEEVDGAYGVSEGRRVFITWSIKFLAIVEVSLDYRLLALTSIDFFPAQQTLFGFPTLELA